MIGAGAFSATATGIGISITAVDATANAFRAVSAKASAFKADITGIGAAFKASALKLLPVDQKLPIENSSVTTSFEAPESDVVASETNSLIHTS